MSARSGSAHQMFFGGKPVSVVMTLTRKDKIQLGVIGAAVILMLVNLSKLWRPQPKETVSEIAGQAWTPPAPLPLQGIWPSGSNASGSHASKGMSLAEIRKKQEELAHQPWARDPFFALPLDETSAREPAALSSGELILTGISIKGSDAIAIVNHTILREGDEAFGMKVASIEKDRVIFGRNGEELVLRFGGAQ